MMLMLQLLIQDYSAHWLSRGLRACIVVSNITRQEILDRRLDRSPESNPLSITIDVLFVVVDVESNYGDS